jgi:hypothetical protein
MGATSRLKFAIAAAVQDREDHGLEKLLITGIEGAIDEDAIVIARRGGLIWVLSRHVRRPGAR